MLEPCYDGALTEAGCDEAGRGCLAGPVFAAAVILEKDFFNEALNDSKKLSEKRRYALREVIEREAVAWAVESVSAEEIDRMNILNASFLAMSRAVEKLSVKPQSLLIDGNMFHTALDIPFTCFVKGDGRFAAIAAASILAKTYRDDYMNALAADFPGYGWELNKGYGTVEHRKAVKRSGLTPHHRKSFNKGVSDPELFPEGYF